MVDYRRQKGAASGLASRRPLDALALVFAGFVLLALVSQLSAHVLGLAILAYYPKGNSDLANVQEVSGALAISAGALGLLFGVSILFVTSKAIAREVDVYIASGLPVSSSLRLILSYHPIRPTAWVVGAAACAAVVDALVGLSVAVPLLLAASFIGLLFAWLGATTFRTYTRSDFRNTGRSG